MGNRSRATAGVGLLVLLATSLLVGPRPTAAAGPLPPELPSSETFRPGPCPFPLAGEPLRRTQCGVLTVPERRDRPTGRTLQLAVAVARARDPERAQEPVIYLAGGPGGSALVELPMWGGSTLGDRHDVILLDQRGTGFSKPSLACSELIIPGDEHWTNEVQIVNYADQVRACRKRLLDDGIDIGAYTTNENAADVAALRVALGIESWNLYGISYGTRLALEVMRDAPAGIRAVVLDSVYPPDVRPFEDHGARLDRALDALIAACAADPPCAQAYPGLGQSFATSVERLERADGFYGVGDVPAHTIEAAFRSALYDVRQYPLLPALLHSAEIGNTAPFLPALDTGPVIQEADSIGMNLSIECGERGQDVDAAAVEADLAAHPRWTALLTRDIYPSACAAWGMPAARAEDLRPVRSSIPTLLLAGSLDPVTPPSFARLAAATLDHAQVVDVPGLGHGVTLVHCPSEIRNAFLVDPSARLDTTCLETVLPKSGWFVTDRVANAGLGRMYHELLFGLNPPSIGHWALAGYVGLVFGLTALVWSARLIRRLVVRRTGSPDDGPGSVPGPSSRIVRVARAVALGAVTADLVFIVGLTIVLAGQPEPLSRDLGLPASAAWILNAASLGALLGIGLAVLAGVLLVGRRGRRRTRVHLLGLAIACLIVSGTLVHYGVLSG